MSSHYVCSGGCLSVQDEPGYCQVEGCYRFRNPLSACDCTDGKHGDWLFRNHPDPVNARRLARYRLQKLTKLFLLAKPKPAPPPHRKVGRPPRQKPVTKKILATSTKSQPKNKNNRAKRTKRTRAAGPRLRESST